MVKKLLLLSILAVPLVGAQAVYPPESNPSWPLRAPTGSAEQPSYSFASRPSSGAYILDTAYAIINYDNTNDWSWGRWNEGYVELQAVSGEIGAKVGARTGSGMEAYLWAQESSGENYHEFSVSVDGYKIETTGTVPKDACTAANRGRVFRVEGGAGVADTYEICAKNSSNTYAWYSLATIP